MPNVDYQAFKSGTDIRGIAVETEGSPVTLTDAAVSAMAAGFGRWLCSRTEKTPSALKIAVGHDSRISAGRISRAVEAALTDMGFDCFEPEGAFYIFPDVSMFAKDGGDFVESLLKAQQVAVVPGDAFGESGKDHVRISYAYSMETLKKAMDRISKFVSTK